MHNFVSRRQQNRVLPSGAMFSIARRGEAMFRAIGLCLGLPEASWCASGSPDRFVMIIMMFTIIVQLITYYRYRL